MTPTARARATSSKGLARELVALEQLRFADRVHALRVLGASSFLVLFAVLDGVLAQRSWHGTLVPTAIYCALSGLVLWWSRRSVKAAGKLTLATALLDMPFVFVLQLWSYPTTPNPAASAGYSLGLFLLLFVFAALSLDDWQLLLTAVVGAVLEVVLQHQAGISAGAMIATLVVMAVAAVLMRYASARMRELVAQTARREKLAVLGQISAGISHDLRNPLTSVSTAVYLLQKRVEKLGVSDPRLEEVAQLATKGVAQCTAIVSELLDYARERPLSLAPTLLAPVVNDALALVKGAPHVTVLNEIDAGAPTVLAERDSLQRVLVNLAQNAVESVPEGAPGTVTLRARVEGLKVVIEITDTGVGMTEATRQEIFEPLFTTKPKGTGLGLSIVQRLVQQHGGTLKVRTALGQGSAFSVTLPLVASPIP